MLTPPGAHPKHARKTSWLFCLHLSSDCSLPQLSSKPRTFAKKLHAEMQFLEARFPRTCSDCYNMQLRIWASLPHLRYNQHATQKKEASGSIVHHRRPLTTTILEPAAQALLRSTWSVWQGAFPNKISTETLVSNWSMDMVPSCNCCRCFMLVSSAFFFTIGTTSMIIICVLLIYYDYFYDCGFLCL